MPSFSNAVSFLMVLAVMSSITTTTTTVDAAREYYRECNNIGDHEGGNSALCGLENDADESASPYYPIVSIRILIMLYYYIFSSRAN